jgi:hypothetical protein
MSNGPTGPRACLGASWPTCEDGFPPEGVSASVWRMVKPTAVPKKAMINASAASWNFFKNMDLNTGTPAMAAKIAGHPWTMEELLTEAESE